MTGIPQSIFFSGVGGSGVSAIACFLARAGHTVAGSDRAFDADPAHPARAMLMAEGVTLHPQDGSGLSPEVGLVVASTAVEATTPEMLRAQALGLTVETRPLFLARLSRAYETIAVAGTSGKSTTSALTAWAMRALGMEPAFIGGGRIRGLGNYLGGGSKLVMEACESDGTIVNYRPARSVILNLGLDHHSVEESGALFRTLAGNTSGEVFVNADDAGLMRATEGMRTVAFGFEARGAEYRATNLRLEGLGSTFDLMGTRFRVPMPDSHNAMDALAAIALIHRMGAALPEIAEAVATFPGVDRRFNVYPGRAGLLVVDDYAHNPDKIEALMHAMNPLAERVCYVFQPHGYGPLKLMLHGYADAFNRMLRATDMLVILPVYDAGGSADRTIASPALGARITGNAVCMESRGELIAMLGQRAGELDAVVVMGARDETLATLAQSIARELNRPL